MQVPAVFFAKDPDERFLAPGDEVVALRLVAVPPAAFDALRAGKQMKILIRNSPRGIEQPERPRPRLAELPRVPFAWLDAAPGALGPVVGLRGKAVDRLAPKARLQPLGKPRPVLAVGLGIAEHR